MKTIKKNVYYCDFCKKKGLSAGHMVAHEKHCTGNPDRICRMCDNTDIIPDIIKEIKARYKIVEGEPINPGHFRGENTPEVVKWIGEPITVEEIQDLVDGCPACMLAIVRQSGLLHYAFTDIINFDYKKAIDEHWAAHNENQRKQEEYGNYY